MIGLRKVKASVKAQGAIKCPISENSLRHHAKSDQTTSSAA
jgi:hypothetical protein